MRVIITGATGFLGGALCDRLLQRGDDVVATGRNPERLAGLQARGCHIIRADLSQPLQPKAYGRADAVIHTAALSAPWGRTADFDRANIAGTRHSLELARHAGASRFVHISTPSVYFRFCDQLGLREDTALPRGVNAYARTKAAAEALVAGADDLDCVILRPRGLYGAGDTALLPRLIRAARRGSLPLVRDGLAVTDLTHIDDVTAACLAALDQAGTLQGRVFNISGGEALTLRSIIEQACTMAGVEPRWRRLPAPALLAAARAAEAVCACLPGRPEPVVTAYGAGLLAYSQTLDISAARTGLGWQPEIRFADGLTRTFAGAAS